MKTFADKFERTKSVQPERHCHIELVSSYAGLPPTHQKAVSKANDMTQILTTKSGNRLEVQHLYIALFESDWTAQRQIVFQDEN